VFHLVIDVLVAFSSENFNLCCSATSTSFAQPSGISLAPGIHCRVLFSVLPVITAPSMRLKRIILTELQELFVADSESSSIRAVNLKTGGSRLLAGGDPVFAENLFRVFLYLKIYMASYRKSATLSYRTFFLANSSVLFSSEIMMGLAQMHYSNIPWVLFMPVTIKYM
jgi:hypothetical protein